MIISYCSIDWWEESMELSDVFRFQISCHKHNLKPILTDYIYRIMSPQSQKGKPRNGFAFFWKTISQIFSTSDIHIFIARLSKNPKIAIYRLLNVWYYYIRISKNARIGLFRQSQQIFKGRIIKRQGHCCDLPV